MSTGAPGGPPEQKKVGKAAAAREWLAGFTTAKAGGAVGDCPHPARTALAYHWLNGYMAGRR